ncbi:hypothetical protein [Virgibacillus sp. DJP39]
MTLYIFGVLFIIALAISIWIRTDIKRLRNEQTESVGNLSDLASGETR